MQFNKWLMFGVSALGGLGALSPALNWASVVSPTTGAWIATGALVIRTVTAMLAPAAGQTAVPVPGSTGLSLVTHT